MEPNAVCKTLAADVSRRMVCTTNIRMFDANTKNNAMPVMEENLA
jgi:hypothetical protein